MSNGEEGKEPQKLLFIDHSAETSKEEKFYYYSSFKVVLVLISENILTKKGTCEEAEPKDQTRHDKPSECHIFKVKTYMLSSHAGESR